MQGVDLRLPIIAMDGAALYDIKEKVYLEAEYLDPAVCEKAEKLIQDNDTHYFANALYDSTLLIFFGRLRNSAEKELYDSHKQSPSCSTRVIPFPLLTVWKELTTTA